jgi:hypothetical protein
MGNDIAAHRAAIGLLYCQINGISHTNEILAPFVFGMFSAIWVNFFRNMFKYVHTMSLINYDVIVITLLVIHLLLKIQRIYCADSYTMNSKSIIE